jgi:hypothetical protein
LSKEEFMHSLKRRATQATLFTCAVVLASSGTSVAAPTYWPETILHTFQATSTTDGEYPSAIAGDMRGFIYGVTNVGGYGRGTAYRLAPGEPGGPWNESQLHIFSHLDGHYPDSILVAKDGSLYGATGEGGTVNNEYGGNGTIFHLTRSGNTWNETILYNFQGSSDGADPSGPLTFDLHGAIYGTTLGGGKYKAGTVYKLSPPRPGRDTWTKTVLYTFGAPGDGANPNGGVIQDERGALYGTTEDGGIRNTIYPQGAGIVFKITPAKDQTTGPSTWKETIVHGFTGANGDGATLFGNLIADRDGALYSTTLQGGLVQGSNCEFGCGTVFKLARSSSDRSSWTESILYDFTGFNGDGAQPVAGLAADRQGTLYGTTTDGGIGNGGSGCGTVFALSPPVSGQASWTESVLHAFVCFTGDGQTPGSDLLLDPRGNVYGTAFYGGFRAPSNAPGNGIVFKLTKPAM